MQNDDTAILYVIKHAWQPPQRSDLPGFAIQGVYTTHDAAWQSMRATAISIGATDVPEAPAKVDKYGIRFDHHQMDHCFSILEADPFDEDCVVTHAPKEVFLVEELTSFPHAYSTGPVKYFTTKARAEERAANYVDGEPATIIFSGPVSTAMPELAV